LFGSLSISGLVVTVLLTNCNISVANPNSFVGKHCVRGGGYPDKKPELCQSVKHLDKYCSNLNIGCGDVATLASGRAVCGLLDPLILDFGEMD
jgi:hypothetical protein